MSRQHGSLARVVVALSVAMSGGLAAQAPGPSSPRLVVLVRHAEKAEEPAADPPLTAAGVARAKALEAALHDAGVTAIITTQLRRTRETAVPLATARNLVPEVVPTGSAGTPAHIAAVVAAIRKHPGGVVLVVGHGNTIPAIVAALGGPRISGICESAYSDLFVVAPGEGTSFLRSRYGALDPPSASDCK